LFDIKFYDQLTAPKSSGRQRLKNSSKTEGYKNSESVFQAFGIWALEFELWDLELGIWNLGFGICALPHFYLFSSVPSTYLAKRP
jgi:hypothetical protein